MDADQVTIVMSRANAQKLLDDAPEPEFRTAFQPQHDEFLLALKNALKPQEAPDG